MHDREDAWRAREAQRWLRPDAHRWMRPDAHRWQKPEFLPPARIEPRERRAAFQASSRSNFYLRREQEETDRELKEIAYQLAANRLELALINYALLQHKAGYNDNQPRWPKGSGEISGRWSGGDGPAKPGIGHNQGPPLGEPPKIPKQRPETSKERNSHVRAVAKWARGALRFLGIAGVAATTAHSWMTQLDQARIEAYTDDPKSYDELQKGAATNRWGYDRHHLVERHTIFTSGFPYEQIHRVDNVVSIPTLKHWELNAWYDRSNAEFGDLSPRQYLRGKDWDTHVKVGRDALIKHGILKP